LFGETRAFLGSGTPPSVRAYIRALELDAKDKTEEARDYFDLALEMPWPEFHAAVVADLFKHFALTGNRYKAEQLWDAVKEDEKGEYVLPARKEFLAYQFALRGYEKQARSL